MSCATDVIAPDSEGPRNSYAVHILGDSSRLSISSDGGVAFAIHTYTAMLKIRSLHRLGTDGTVQITVVHNSHSHHQPIVRGGILRVFVSSTLPIMVQVLHSVGGVLFGSLRGK